MSLRLPEPEWACLDWVVYTIWGSRTRRVKPLSYGLTEQGVDTSSLHVGVVETVLESRSVEERELLRKHFCSAADHRIRWGEGIPPALWIGVRRDVLEGCRVAYAAIQREAV